MTNEQLTAAFKDWWGESFPMACPSPKTVETHVAFAAHVLELASVLAEYKESDR